jgi:hypothetical protein
MLLLISVVGVAACYQLTAKNLLGFIPDMCAPRCVDTQRLTGSENIATNVDAVDRPRNSRSSLRGHYQHRKTIRPHRRSRPRLYRRRLRRRFEIGGPEISLMCSGVKRVRPAEARADNVDAIFACD